MKQVPLDEDTIPTIQITQEPKTLPREYFETIVYRWLLPIPIISGLFNLLLNKIIKKFALSQLIMQSIGDKNWQSAKDVFEGFDNKGEFSFKQYTLETKDGAEIDSAQLSPKNIAKDRPYIIYFPGNGELYEQMMPGYSKMAEKLNANMIFFNYRGAGSSKGQANSSNDFVKDGYAQVQKLIDEGVDPKNIVLFGHSIGGGIASVLAEKLHAEKDKDGESTKPVKIFNDRSFSSLTNVIVGATKEEGAIPLPKIGKNPISRQIVRGIVKFALYMSSYEINAAESFRNIPDEYKEYAFARDTDKYSDRVITQYGSLHEAVKQDYKKTPRFYAPRISVAR